MSGDFSEENNRQIGALQADMVNVKEDVSEMKADMKEVLATLAEAKGYWKMGLIIAGFSATIGAFVSWVISFLPGR